MKEKKEKPCKLNCGEGIVAEVDKGCFIGKDGENFIAVYDICEAYIAKDSDEFGEYLNGYWHIFGEKGGYPKFYPAHR